METDSSIWTSFTFTIDEVWKAIPDDVRNKVELALGVPPEYDVQDWDSGEGKLNLNVNKECGAKVELSVFNN